MRPEPPPDAPPTRSRIATAPCESVHEGAWSKADIYEVLLDGRRIVVKDFAAKSFPIRWLGRLQITRELAAYRALHGIHGVAHCLGRIDAHALALERVEGIPLRRHRNRPEREELLKDLKRILDGVHACGVIHNDLRGSDNALVREDGRVVLIDFAGAFRFRKGSLLDRLLFPTLARVDHAAYLKWKTILAPESLTAEEHRFLRRFGRLRRLWVFNPKGALRQS